MCYREMYVWYVLLSCDEFFFFFFLMVMKWVVTYKVFQNSLLLLFLIFIIFSYYK
jgi:hypothetical protein